MGNKILAVRIFKLKAGLFQKIHDFLDLTISSFWKIFEEFVFEVGAVFHFGFYSLKSFFKKALSF